MDELRKYVSTSALHDTSTRQGDQTTKCHPKTRQKFLVELADVLGGSQNRVNWLYGPAGAGKTSIMRSLASLFERRGQFIGGFHFWRSDSSRNTLKHFVATLAFQLAQNEPTTEPSITRALTQDRLLLDKSAETQMEKLIIGPLLISAARKTSAAGRCILIDGLDECDEDGQREFLENLLPTFVSRLSSVGITFFIASRPERAIDNLFTHPRLSNSTNRILLEPSPEDVREFLVAGFEEVNRCHPKLKEKHGGQWPRDEQLGRLVEKSSGYFILCATAMRHINPPVLHGRPPDQRLDDVLEAVSADPLRPLDALYLFILRQHAPTLPGLFEEWKRLIGRVCMPLDLDLMHEYARLTGRRPESVPSIALCYGKESSALEELLFGLESLVYFEKETGRPKIYHASFPDFIFNRNRSQDFFMDRADIHVDHACVIVKTLNIESLVDYPPLWTDIFSYHLEHASMADGRLARVIDDINWPAFSKRFDAFDRSWCGLFSGLDILASIFDELQKFYDRFDVPAASQRRQSVVFGLTPIAEKALGAATPPDVFDEFGSLDTRYGEILVAMWQCLVGLHPGLSSRNSPTLLHTHSTLCLQHQNFPTAAQARWDFSCIRVGCLAQDSDDYQMLVGSLRLYEASNYWNIAHRILNLLTSLDFAVHPMMSRFFNEMFSLRCSVMLSRTPGAFSWEMSRDKGVEVPYFTFYSIDIIIRYLRHSAPSQSLLDRLWEILFLHDGGQLFSQLKYYADNENTRRGAENPVYFRTTQLVLAYFNLCLQSSICPTIMTHIITNKSNEDGHFESHIPTPLSEREQRDLWSKYSTFVPYIPLSLPDDFQTPYADKDSPSAIDSLVVSDDQTRLARKPQEVGTSSATPFVSQVVSVLPQTGLSSTGTVKRRRKRSLWKRLLHS